MNPYNTPFGNAPFPSGTDPLGESAKKRLLEMRLVHDPNEWKSERETHYLTMQKNRRKAIFDLARETSMLAATADKSDSTMQGIDEEESKGDVSVNRIQYAAKLSLYEYMTKIPSDLVPKWLIYAIPDGTKCIICTSDKRTVIRDKCGYLIEHANTLLPNGNPNSIESGKTMLQGIYNKRDKTVFLTDLLMWDDELFIDSIAEVRLLILMNKLRENVAIAQTLEPMNELRFRMPQIMDCSKVALDQMYYGLYTQMQAAGFVTEYEKLVNHAQAQELLPLIKVKPEETHTNEGAMKVCAAFGFDNTGAPYLKDGLAFIQKEGIFFLGYNIASVQWKDKLVSPYYEALLQTPMVGYLYYDKGKRLQTHDGYIIDKTDPAIDTLKPDQTYMFTYNGIYLNEPYATLDGLKYYQNCAKIVWSSMSNLVFKVLARKNMLTYQVLAQQIQSQETSYKGMVQQ